MWYIPLQTFFPWRLGICILQAISVVSTCLRIFHRYRTRKIWWDDHVTAIPMFIQFVNITTMWLRFRDTPISMDTRVLFSLLSSLCFTTINWGSRVSLGLAVLRIIPEWSRVRPYVVVTNVAFVLFWLSLTAGMLTICGISTAWQHTGDQVLICGPAYRLTIASTVLDVVGDLILIAIPMHRLWRLNLPASERRLIRLVFSASVITLISSILLCVVSYGNLIFGPGANIVWLMACRVGEAISIITSNLLVLTCLYRHYFPPGENLEPMEIGDIHITPHWSNAGKGEELHREPSPDVLVFATRSSLLSEESSGLKSHISSVEGGVVEIKSIC